MRSLGAPAAVRVLDEPRFLKKGRDSAGVTRRGRRTAGHGEHGQKGVIPNCASRLGHAWLDRERHWAKGWTDATVRCRQAGIPAHRRFATKPQLAQQMLQQARAAGVTARWVTDDSVYGGD